MEEGDEKEQGNLCGWSSWKCARHLKDERLQNECVAAT